MRGSTEETCPRCGYGAGLYVAPRDARTAETPVRCLSCRHEAVIQEWRPSPISAAPDRHADTGIRP